MIDEPDVAMKCLMVRTDLYNAVGCAASTVVLVRDEGRAVFASINIAIERLVLTGWREAE